VHGGEADAGAAAGDQSRLTDTGTSLFIDHRDPAVIRQLGSFRIHD
jgi:hypothetical protein